MELHWGWGGLWIKPEFWHGWCGWVSQGPLECVCVPLHWRIPLLLGALSWDSYQGVCWDSWFGLFWGFVTRGLDWSALLLFFSFHSSLSKREMLIFDCYLHPWGRREGKRRRGWHFELYCVWGAFVLGLHGWAECKFIIYCQWKMLSALQKKTKIWGHITSVSENNMQVY